MEVKEETVDTFFEVIKEEQTYEELNSVSLFLDIFKSDITDEFLVEDVNSFNVNDLSKYKCDFQQITTELLFKIEQEVSVQDLNDLWEDTGPESDMTEGLITVNSIKKIDSLHCSPGKKQNKET
ncbi:uncharacterized protein LOC114329093 isoform X3 [Diabrotica virgifera virgifera]|uniref:Uncharacterized protein LOC114329093 isoform X2 n=1 Tax=Diabrotica virgifera virgifera TaxID=50390 RepID=A0A6P7FG67_DIAVI|nr:uncharacterized protein LOC114329093 isoform X3 [Diabrotica virgifera virgifera]